MAKHIYSSESFSNKNSKVLFPLHFTRVLIIIESTQCNVAVEHVIAYFLADRATVEQN